MIVHSMVKEGVIVHSMVEEGVIVHSMVEGRGDCPLNGGGGGLR